MQTTGGTIDPIVMLHEILLRRRDMRKIGLVLLIGLVILGLVAGCAQSRKITIGTDATYPPFESVDESTGEVVGFDPDLMAEIADLAKLLKDVLLRLRLVLSDPAYNFIIHTSPINHDGDLAHYHWHIKLMPKLTRVAGFEWGTGFYFVSTPPELAAKYLREAKV